MMTFRMLLAACALATMLSLGTARADEPAPLFVNLASDDAFRSTMAVTFSKGLQQRGHPLTIFLNDRGALLASRRNADRFADQQQVLSGLIAAGAVVIVCPLCLQQFEIAEADLLPGMKVGSPELTGGALFKEGTRTLSW